MINFSQWYIRKFIPSLNFQLAKILYKSKNISFGKNGMFDAIPRILIDKEAKLFLGDNLELRSGVEIRVHGKSSIKLGNNVRIDRGVRILATNNAEINIKNGVRIGLYTVLNGGDSISIGSKTLISGFVYLQTSMHGYSNRELSVQDQGFNHAPIILEEDVWLGTHVVILPGVKLEKGVVVGSNAVVNKSVESFKVVGGIPAKELKERQ